MKYAIKMTGPVQQVLRAMLEDATVPRYGLEISNRPAWKRAPCIRLWPGLSVWAGWKAAGRIRT